MKTLKNSKSIALLLGAILLISVSCVKEQDKPGSATPISEGHKTNITDKDDRIKLKNMAQRLPTLAVYNQVHDDYIFLDLNNAKNGFSFTDPGFSASFTSPDGGGSFATGPDGSEYIIITPGTSSGNGGGSVGAGSTTLDLNFVFCFSADEESFGFDLFDFEGENTVDGFSGAVGVSGDFEALMNGNIDEEADPFDYFFGMAFYYILDDNPAGSYEVVNFLDETPDSEIALAVLISFVNNGGLYFSNSGQLDFQDSSVGFDGTYVGIENFILTFSEDFEEDQDFVQVPGFGYINCGS